MSAANAGALWDLRCDVREKIIAFLQQEHPQALPRARTEVKVFTSGAAALILELRLGPDSRSHPLRESATCFDPLCLSSAAVNGSQNSSGTFGIAPDCT